MVKLSIINELIRILSLHARFEYTDFNIESTKPVTTSGVEITITYLDDPRYKYVFVLPNQVGSIFSGRRSPGNMAFEETLSFATFPEILSSINAWQDNIWGELMQAPIAREQQLHKQKIEELFAKVNTETTEYFTKKEAENIKRTLEDIENQFNEKLEALITDVNELKAEKDLLHKDIETLKSTSQVFAKSSWQKSLITKIVKWVSKTENQDLLGSGVDIIKGFLDQPST